MLPVDPIPESDTNSVAMTRPRVSIEIWFALCGLLIGLALLLYGQRENSQETFQGPIAPSQPSSPTSAAPNPTTGTPVTLGEPVTINQVPSPKIESPEADPLLPPTSAQLDAVLALKYYLLSDAHAEALVLYDSLTDSSRDLVVRSALYAVWERDGAGHGDWFMGSTSDPYTARQSALKLGDDPARNTDTADAPVTNSKLAAQTELATQRIALAHRLLKKVEAKTQAYWLPYLVVKLRRLGSEEQQPLIDNLVKEGNLAIKESLQKYDRESQWSGRWSWTNQFFKAGFPLLLSAIGFILAKVSQSTLTAVDRWVVSRWTKLEKPPEK